MHYLYGIEGSEQKLVATFDTEAQLLAYLRWATPNCLPNQSPRFRQTSALKGFSDAIHVAKPYIADDAGNVAHNPSPSEP